MNFAGKPVWIVVFDDQVHTQAMKRIDELFPCPSGQESGPARKDMLGWYFRWMEELRRNPFRVLGAPPLNTDHPNRARFPADGSLAVSGIADVDRAHKTITVLAVYIRAPRSLA